MMIIAVIIGALLMPAQISAQSRGEKRGEGRVQVDSKRGGDKKKKDGSFGKSDKRGRFDKHNKPGGKNIHIGKGHGHNHGHKHGHKPPVVHHRPRVLAGHCHHNHRHRPVVVHRHDCNGDIVGAAAAVIGTVALISLLAD